MSFEFCQPTVAIQRNDVLGPDDLYEEAVVVKVDADAEHAVVVGLAHLAECLKYGPA